MFKPVCLKRLLIRGQHHTDIMRTYCSHVFFGCSKDSFDTLVLHESSIDSLIHYLKCPVLNSIIGKCCGWTQPMHELGWLCLADNCSPLGTCIAYTVYHALKLSFRKDVEDAVVAFASSAAPSPPLPLPSPPLPLMHPLWPLSLPSFQTTSSSHLTSTECTKLPG